MIRRAWLQCLVGGGGWAEVCSGLWQHSSEVRHWALVTYVIAAGYLSAPGLNCTTQIRTWGLFLTSTIPMALPGCSGHARKASFSWANWCTLHIWRWPSFTVSWNGFDDDIYRISANSFHPWIVSTLVRKLFKFSLHKRKLNAETIWDFQGFKSP